MWGNHVFKRHMHQRKASWLILFAMLVIAGCSGGGNSTAAAPTATTPAGNPGGGPTKPVPTIPPNAHIKPVPADYSVYVDPTYHYSVQYPVTWFVQPGIGQNESNVVFSEPVTNPYDPNFYIHPVTQLLVRATNNYQESFVEKILCSGLFPAGPNLGPYQTVNLLTYGGTATAGYGAPAYGIAFFAKGMAFEIWLQSASKIAIQAFFDAEKDHWDHILATFNVGPGSPGGKPVAEC
jgi:hypothetical protein